jgi:hypothetical protein
MPRFVHRVDGTAVAVGLVVSAFRIKKPGDLVAG